MCMCEHVLSFISEGPQVHTDIKQIKRDMGPNGPAISQPLIPALRQITEWDEPLWSVWSEHKQHQMPTTYRLSRVTSVTTQSSTQEHYSDSIACHLLLMETDQLKGYVCLGKTRALKIHMTNILNATKAPRSLHFQQFPQNRSSKQQYVNNTSNAFSNKNLWL